MEIHKLQQLLSEMSLQEKIGQMVQLTGVYFDKEAVLTGVVGEQLPPEWVIQYAGSVLGVIGKEKICDIQSKYMEQHPHHIPLLFMADVIHGCRTIFPIPLGQACSFHPELVSEAASIAASEASSEGLKATFSPMIDVSRDPRWGRMLESFGEDPYVNGVMGEAMVDGYQQKNDEGIAACLKHFAGYGALNAGREYNGVEISQRTFLEQYVKPFRMALKAKPAMVMTAFNAIDRKPIYHVDRTVIETGKLFGDEAHIIYVNSQIHDESALGKLMYDFYCTDAGKMNYEILADRVRYFKEDEKGVATMSRVMEEMRNETERAKAIKDAKGMLESGKLTYEEIAKIAELTIDEVRALDKKVTA